MRIILSLVLASALTVSSPALAHPYDPDETGEQDTLTINKAPADGLLMGQDWNDTSIYRNRPPCDTGFKPVSTRDYYRYGKELSWKYGDACIRTGLHDCPRGRIFEARAVIHGSWNDHGKRRPLYDIYLTCTSHARIPTI